MAAAIEVGQRSFDADPDVSKGRFGRDGPLSMCRADDVYQPAPSDGVTSGSFEELPPTRRDREITRLPRGRPGVRMLVSPPVGRPAWGPRRTQRVAVWAMAHSTHVVPGGSS